MILCPPGMYLGIPIGCFDIVFMPKLVHIVTDIKPFRFGRELNAQPKCVMHCFSGFGQGVALLFLNSFPNSYSHFKLLCAQKRLFYTIDL